MKRKTSRLDRLSARGDQLRFNIVETKAILANLELELAINTRLWSQESERVYCGGVVSKTSISKFIKTLKDIKPSPFASLIKKHNKENRK